MFAPSSGFADGTIVGGGSVDTAIASTIASGGSTCEGRRHVQAMWTVYEARMSVSSPDSRVDDVDSTSALLDQPFASSEMGDSMDADLLPELSGGNVGSGHLSG